MEMIPVKITHKTRYSYRADNGVNTCWAWACEQFGAPGQRPEGFRWQWDTHNTFFFRDQADAVLFALRWAH